MKVSSIAYLRVIVSACEGKLAYLGVIHVVSVCEGKLAYLGVIVSACEGKVNDHAQCQVSPPQSVH